MDSGRADSDGGALDATVLVTPRSFGRDDPTLREELQRRVADVRYAPSSGMTPDELLALVADVDGWIAGLDYIDSRVLTAARKLRVIARYGVAYDRVDLAAAEEHGIVVTHTPGANSDAVAELTIGLIFALARQIVAADGSVRGGSWPRVEGRSVADRTVGVLGLGAVGRAVAWRARAVGCEVVAHDPFADAAFAANHGIALAAEADVVGRADFLCLHVPLVPETQRMVDDLFLARMRPGAFLVNASRGEVIDEHALVRALESGRLRGAALDTLTEEPPPPGHPLLERSDVILTPHMGAQTDGATSAMGRAALNDCLSVLSGRNAKHPVGRSRTPA
jgi:D-3-phosphoglycerate dehydrogenase